MVVTMNLLYTQLHNWHAQHAKMVPFAGFEMPVVYNAPSSISNEHLAVRNAAGLFDVSHMGRMIVAGKDAQKFIDILVPRDILSQPIGKVSYCYFLNEAGGFRDDTTIARISENEFLITWNAGNLEKIRHWVNDLAILVKKTANYTFTIQDISANSAMFAFQGPKAPELTKKLFGVYPGSWKYAPGTLNGENIPVHILGSGYTGEAGCEIVILNTTVSDPQLALKVWETILKQTTPDGVIPCGLGARDTLRMEAGMPLYGNEIDELISPFQAGLAGAPLVKMDKVFFMGQEALRKLSARKDLPKRVGLLATSRGPSPRAGMRLMLEGKDIGYVCSGSFSPLLKIGFGMGYIQSDINYETEIIAKTQDKEIPVIIKPIPLYNTDLYGSKRKH